MSHLQVNRELCTGCGICLSVCATSALSLVQQPDDNAGHAVAAPANTATTADSTVIKLQVDAELCSLCGICIDACPNRALSITKETSGRTVADAVASSSMETDAVPSAGGIWVFAEYHKMAVHTVVYELLGKGRELADKLQRPLTAVLCGRGVSDHTSSLIQAGADVVIIVDNPHLEDRQDDCYCHILHELVQEHNPEILLFGATSFGRSLAPRLAARLRTGLTADCTVLDIDLEKHLLLQTRPAFGGNLMATIICPQHRPQMATVRPGVMTALAADPRRTGRIISKTYEAPASDLVQLLSSKEVTITSIANAKTIVAVGRGIGSAKNVNYARELAELLGGELGCSRPVVDIGWCEYKHQIGQTGCVVAPDLLISCGISGAIQHLAGMANAKTIVAINSDPDAPIFELAHYKIVGDCVEILRELIAQVIGKNPPMDIA